MLTKTYLYLANIIPTGQVMLDANDVTPKATPGGVGIYMDAFGPRWFRYVKNVSGSVMALGDVISRAADITASSLTLGTTTGYTTSGLTADAHKGKLVIVEVGGSAAAAPEGETGVIVANSATLVTIDANYPFSAAPGNNSDTRIFSPGWHAIDSATSDLAKDVLGVVVGADGISDGYYGWAQFQGYCPLTAVTAAAIAADAAIVTGTKAVATIGAGAANTVVGYSPGAVAATNAGKAPMFLTLLGGGAVNL